MNEVMRQVSGHRNKAVKYAQIVDNIVTLIILVDPAYKEARPGRYSGQWIKLQLESGEEMPCGIGWTWSGSEFIPPPDPEDPATSDLTEATP